MNWNAIFAANPKWGTGTWPLVQGYLVKVRLNRGGYDEHGRYWGLGQPLYKYEIADEHGRYIVSDHIRATSRNHAKDLIRRRHGSEYNIHFVR